MLLSREACGAWTRQIPRQEIEIVVALPLGERVLELELAVEMVLDDAFVAAGDKNEMLDAGRSRLIDDVLDQRPVDDRQHLLRHRLGCGQEPRPQSGHRKNRFSYGSHASP